MARPSKIPYSEILGMKFGKLLPTEKVGYVNGRMTWACKCECGNMINVIQKNLTNGNTKSCGCLIKEIAHKRKKEYDHKERLYVLWIGIKQRCYNPNNISYKWYGAKGVNVCSEWQRDYLAFREWMLNNGYDETLPRGIQTIDRINFKEGYSPENCRLITITEQQRNKKDNVLYEFNGEKHLLCEWSEILGIDYSVLKSRVGDYGWSIKEAIENPKFSKVKFDKKTITFNGETKSIKEWSEKLGIKENTIRGRMCYYSEPEKILNINKNKRTKRGQ